MVYDPSYAELFFSYQIVVAEVVNCEIISP